ncbi:MAG: DUF3999 family protein [Lutibacter sp.]|uniref:DUF3999 family protein n=1 Tax=Lutibacter sp. TaxID=1925666 RepID=UPI00385D4108
MKLKAKISTFLLLLFSSYSFGQMQQNNYKRELQGINNTWHKVILPEEIFEKVAPNLNDIRIYGITSKNDTLEASYLLQTKTEKLINKEVNFKIINSSHNKNGYYFTFEVVSRKTINQLKLNFKQLNFNWKLNLEGSQNQLQWFTIINDYRILSITNKETNYQFTKLNFPSSKYHYLRLLIKGKEKPELSNVKITSHEIYNGSYNTYSIEKIKKVQKKEQKVTILEIDLKSTVPVSSVKIKVKNTFDYYRPITIQYVSDSVKSEMGWISNYQTLTRGTLNSFEKNEFKFKSRILKKIKITIYNSDNSPLTIDTITVKGYIHQLIVRFTKPAKYFLTYGNKKASKPNYDIERFISKIPDTLALLNLGKEQLIIKKKIQERKPLFINKNWLWAIMFVIIVLLGWFSVKMIKSN